MSIIRRVANPQGWTSIPNAALEDERLSYRARGVLAYLLSRPPDWETDSERMAQKGKEGRDALRTALNELEAVGYMHRRRVQSSRGTWSTERFVYDHPVTSIEDAENPTLPPVDNPVEGSGDSWGQPTPENPPPATGKPTPENPASLTTTQNKYRETSPGDPTRALAALVGRSATAEPAEPALLLLEGSLRSPDEEPAAPPALSPHEARRLFGIPEPRALERSASEGASPTPSALSPGSLALAAASGGEHGASRVADS